MMEKNIESALSVLKAALWGTKLETTNPDEMEEVFLFLQKHAVQSVPASIISNINMHDSLRSIWKKRTLLQVFRYVNILNVQNEVLAALAKEEVPVVVVKGTSASQYYPAPKYRTMGDIDLLVRKEDFYRAEEVMLSCGCTTTESDHDVDRHITLDKSGMMIELHWRFASENVIDDPMAFDEILYRNIVQGRTILSSPENGLVLLEHIAQHLNNGIGLRQIIDWMMFVYRCLDDVMWEKQFRDLATKTGLDKLAINTTRMCQIYLGLTDRDITWCKQADEKVCENLMDYIINCGNFGRARESWDSGEITKIPSLIHPVRLLNYLQERGKKGWKLYRKYPVLKPFAWIYQLKRYIRIAKKSKAQGVTVKDTYDKGSLRRNMFKELGITIKN